MGAGRGTLPGERVLLADMAGCFAVRMALGAPASHPSSEIIVWCQTHLAVPAVWGARQPGALGHPLPSFTSILLFCLLFIRGGRSGDEL